MNVEKIIMKLKIKQILALAFMLSACSPDAFNMGTSKNRESVTFSAGSLQQCQQGCKERGLTWITYLPPITPPLDDQRTEEEKKADEKLGNTCGCMY
jgi:hypothetical protein